MKAGIHPRILERMLEHRQREGRREQAGGRFRDLEDDRMRLCRMG